METVTHLPIFAGILVWILWLSWALHTWSLHFSSRKPRSDPLSPSRRHPPATQPKCPARTFRRTLATVEELRFPNLLPGSVEVSKPESPKQWKCPVQMRHSVLSELDLDMNHVHLSLWQYLWASHWIALPALSLVIFGWLQIQLAKLLSLCNLLPEASEVELKQMIYNLVLENLCIGVADIQETKSGRVATFVYSPFPLYLDSVDSDELHVVAEVKNRMVVKLNLSSAEFVSAVLDGKICNVTDAAVLLAHYVINVNHPKMHAYANWGFDPADSSNPYLQKMSVVTTCYNHFGFTNFPMMASNMVRKDAGPCFEACLRESMSSGVPEHKLVVALAEHSKLLNFIISLKMPFKQAFKHCNEAFPPNYNCEAHFLGTVVHSLDHYAFCQTINPWLFSALRPSAHLKTLHSTVLLARCCALDDIPTVGLEKYFKDGSTEFHRMVYSAAKGLDKSLADQIQTCIVK